MHVEVAVVQIDVHQEGRSAVIQKVVLFHALYLTLLQHLFNSLHLFQHPSECQWHVNYESRAAIGSKPPEYWCLKRSSVWHGTRVTGSLF